jgi:hypothetical protein
LLPTAIASICAISPTLSKGIDGHYRLASIATPAASRSDTPAIVAEAERMCRITPRITCRRKRAKPAIAGQVHAEVMRHSAEAASDVFDRPVAHFPASKGRGR